jgi:hypothetical protein
LHIYKNLPTIVDMDTIIDSKTKTRMLVTLPADLVAALEAEAEANCARPSQIARALLAKALRERLRSAGANGRPRRTS